MAQVTVSVNGRPVQEYLGKEKSREIEQFLREEFREMSRMSHGHISSKPSGRSQTKVQQVGNGSIRFA